MKAIESSRRSQTADSSDGPSFDPWDYRVSIEKSIRAMAHLYRLSTADTYYLSQDFWVNVLSNKNRIVTGFAGRSSYTTYLSRIVSNYTHNWTRNRRRSARQILAIGNSTDLDRLSRTSIRRPAEKDASIETRGDLQLAMAHLTDGQRWLLEQWCQGITLPQLAARLEISPNAAACRLNRVLRQLRRVATSGRARC
jgi:RNA polymerase sigma factor (sigma-70 family)